MAARETWKPIPRYKGRYEASTLGRVRNAKTNRVLRTYPNRYGYLMISTYPDKMTLVSGLIAETFIGPRPVGMQVEHLNQDKQDNRPQNLAYMTSSQNIKRSYLHGSREKVRAPRLSKQAYALIHELWATGQYSQVQIAKLTGITNSAVSRIVRGKTKPCGKVDLVIRDVDVSTNGRKAHFVTIGGQMKSLREWLRIYALPESTYFSRRRRGLSPVEAIVTPKRGAK